MSNSILLNECDPRLTGLGPIWRHIKEVSIDASLWLHIVSCLTQSCFLLLVDCPTVYNGIPSGYRGTLWTVQTVQIAFIFEAWFMCVCVMNGKCSTFTLTVDG